MRELGTITSEQLQLGMILEERVIEPSDPQLEGQVCFECGSWDGPLKTSLVTMWELTKSSWCPNANAGQIWELTAEIELEGYYDESLHNLAMIHHLLALKITRQDDNQPTEPSEGNSPKRLNEGGYLPDFQLWIGMACMWERSLLENIE